MMTRDGKFRKSGNSDTGNCVEVAALPGGGLRVRDSKDKAGPVLGFNEHEWEAFLAGAKQGEFDLPE
jgi:hypothetical protein